MSICKKCANYEINLDDMLERCLADNDMALAEEDCENFRFNVAERVTSYRDRAKENGWVRRDYYATPREHGKLRDLINKLRAKS